MSYMENNAAFAPAGGIQELSFDEIEQVEGAGWVTRGVYAALVVVGVSSGVALVAGVAVGIGVAYYN
ncbi:hypothetical protein [Sphingorhabdus sp.]|uniref:hypothetical protein n=1 Tax=Sphingorhabdus sp. TaxID=1902408 RepID=UPI00391CDCBD